MIVADPAGCSASRCMKEVRRVMKKSVAPPIAAVLCLLVFVICVSSAPASAQRMFQVGSSNTVSADPYVIRPKTTPCIVQLFQNVAFEDFNPYNFTYTPPANCPGPWQVVVFEADISVTAGVQYDRTANFWLGGANIYFGTTAEPGSTLSPSWHVETNLTDYSPLFSVPQNGQADIGNLVNSQYTGIIYASATLEFYPLDPNSPAPKRPFDMVLPMSASSDGGTVTLNTTTDTLSETFTLPTNIQRAYLDVYAQSQSNDEFWYTCVPNDVSSELQSCGNTAFREGEITIDGTPAGVAPIYPWIYTGGIDPFLWFPITGVQTLNFVPYRVNLTPFAGMLSDGQPHTVALSVYNADSYFSATANLLLLLDPKTPQLTGAIVSNTLSASPTPNVQEDLKTSGNGTITGTVTVTSDRNFTIEGYTDNGRSRVYTTVTQTIDFSNQQSFNIGSANYIQDIAQTTTISSSEAQTNAAGTITTSETTTYPLNLNINYEVNSDGSSYQTTTVKQEDTDQTQVSKAETQTFSSTLDNLMQTTDTLNFDSGGNFTGNTNQSSSQDYTFYNSNPLCYNWTLEAVANILTAANNNCTGGSGASAKK
jgi:hypothetical protein